MKLCRYYFSVGYNNSKGTTKGDNLERYNLNLNLSTDIGKFVNVEGKLSFSDRKSDGFYMVNPSDYALSASRAISKDEFYTTPIFYCTRIVFKFSAFL